MGALPILRELLHFLMKITETGGRAKGPVPTPTSPLSCGRWGGRTRVLSQHLRGANPCGTPTGNSEPSLLEGRVAAGCRKLPFYKNTETAFCPTNAPHALACTPDHTHPLKAPTAGPAFSERGRADPLGTLGGIAAAPGPLGLGAAAGRPAQACARQGTAAGFVGGRWAGP